MEQRELHLRDYLRVVKKRKYTVFTVFVLVVAAVVIATLSTTPLYRGDVEVLIEKQEQNSLMGGSRWYSSYDPEFYETQFQLIKSLSVAKRVVQALGLEAADASLWGEKVQGGGVLRLGLDRLVELFAAAQEALGLAPIAAPEEEAADGETKSERADEIAAYVRAGVSVQPVRDSRIAQISYVSPNPRLAADIANAVANAYIEEILEIRLGGARRTLDWTAKKAEEERFKLERSEQKLQKYMRDHDIVTLGDQLTVTPQKLSEISTHLTRAEARLRELQVLHEKVLELSASAAQLDTLPAIASDPALGALRAEILKAEQRQTELARKYGAKHPTMVQATEDLAVLRTKKKQEIDRRIASLQNEYEMAVANERELRGLLEETRSQASGLNEKMIQYGMLKRAAEANRQMYDALTKQLKEQSVTEDTQTVSLWIVDEAKPAKFPFKPRTKRNAILGLILGLFAGIGMAFFIEYLDHSVKNPEDAEARIGLPVLGVISRVRGRGKNVETAFVGDSLAVVGEEFKSLRTAVFLSSAGGPPPVPGGHQRHPGRGKDQHGAQPGGCDRPVRPESVVGRCRYAQAEDPPRPES